MKQLFTLFKSCLLAVFLLSVIHGSAQTTLTDGDIVITRISADTPDNFSALFLTDVAPTTVIYFTNEGWTGTALTNAYYIMKMVVESTISAGEEVHVDFENFTVSFTSGLSPATVTISSVGVGDQDVSAPGANFSSVGGDNIWVYQGSPASPTFICGINADVGVSGSSGDAWEVGEIGSSTRLMSGKNNGQDGYFGLFPAGADEVDNARYKTTAPHSGDKATLLTAIMDLSNWEFNNTTPMLASTIAFSVSGGNTAPTATAPTAPTVLEDATNVALDDDIQVADADADDTQTVTFTITGGTLTIGETGITFTVGSNGSSLFKASGSLDAINTALDAATFTPTPDLNGVSAGVITLVSNDGTTDSNQASVSFDITPVNDPPSISTNNPLSLNEGATGTITSASHLSATDIDNDDADLIFTITTNTSNGVVKKSGTTLNLNDTFLQSDLTAGNISYVHDDSNTTSDSFGFKVSDGSAELTNQTFSISVTAINDDTPTIAVNEGLTLNEGATKAITTTELAADDTDTDNTTLTFTVTSAPSNGQLENTDHPGNAIISFTQQHLIDGKVQYVHDGSNTTSDSFTFKVTDDFPNELTGQTFSITVYTYPIVTTQAVTSITSTTATGNGNITNLGVPNPTAHGVCWSTSENPTTAGSKDDKGAASATGAFTASITGLSAGTTYYVRAFATNAAGTVYGSQESFSTFPTLADRTFEDIWQGIYYTKMHNLFFDYKDEDGTGNSLQSIRILTLPANGTLFIDNDVDGIIDDGEAITADQEILRWQLIGGWLRYLNTDGVNSSFTYDAYDGTTYTNIATATLNIIPPPTVTFTSSEQSQSEATTSTITITAELSEMMGDHQVSVPFTVEGTATKGVDYTITESPVVFNPGDETKDIVITVSNDELDEVHETVVVNMGEPTNAAQGATTTFTATINDDDPAPDVEFSTISSEGFESVSSADLQVNLSAASGLPVSVNYEVTGTATATGADCLLANGTLSFLAGESSRNITIASIVDNLQDEDNETVIVTLSNPTNAGLGTNTEHTYTIKDDDPTPTVAFTTTSSSGLESVSSAALQVDLSATSGREVRVDYAVTGSATGSGTDFTLANGTLIIGSGNPNGNITIASIVNDFLDESDETVVVTLSNPSNATLGTNTEHIYTITDDDTVGFTITESDGSTSVTEPNTTDSYTVVLDAQPTSDVVLDIASGDTGEVTVDKTSLTFTSANWDVSQEVTVTAADDNLIDGNQTTAITISVNDGGSDDTFDGLPDQEVSVATTDNDVAGFSLSKPTATITESGTSDFFTVVLDAEPTSPVVLNISDGGTDEATLDKTTLTFTSENWDTPQNITITPVDDFVDDGDQSITLTISVDAGGSDNDFDAVANKTVTVTSTDDDTSDFVLSKLSASVAENGSLDSFTARLTSKPASQVVLNVVSADVGEVRVDKASLTFTGENWNAPQTIIVSGVDDAIADGDQITSITLSVDAASSDNAFDGAANQNVSCTNTDDEEVGFTFWEGDAYTVVKESGTTDIFTVVLDGPPATDVVLSVNSGDLGEVTVDKASLTFTNSNWNVAQIVTVTGVNDAASDGSQATNITLSVVDGSSDDAFDNLEDQAVRVITTDDDGPGITIVETNSSTIGWERGKIDTIWVSLNSRPTSNVTLSFARAYPTELDIERDEYVFEPDDWDTPKDFRIAGENDGVLDGDVVVPLTIGVVDSKSDDAYDVLPDIIINAINIDNEVASFSVENPTSSVDESVTTASFSVVLDVQPVSNVVFTVSSGDTEEVTVNKSTLTFTNANWDTKQIVTLTGVNDDLADGSQSTDITISVDAANSQDEFDDLEDKTIRVTTTDDDANYTLSKNTVSVTEAGGTDEITVVLNGPPSSNVVLSVTSADSGEATVDQATLTFTPGNWNSPQKVTITGIDDLLVDGNMSTGIIFSVVDGSSDAAFATAVDQTVTCITNDDDVAGFTLTESDGSTSVVESGTTDSFSVVLTAQPVSDVVFNISSADTGEATVDKASLTFTTANWDTPQTVIVTGANDILTDGDQTTLITVSVDQLNSDNAFDALPNQTASVLTIDDDLREINVQYNGNDLSDGSTTVSEALGTDFGDLDIAEGSRDRTFTILNTGETNLEVSSVNLSDSGSGFGVSGITLPTSIAAGESTTFVVSFDPAVTGSKSVTVAIGNNDSDENPFDFKVSGTGTARPVMAVQGNSVLIADDSDSPSEGNGTHWGDCSVGQSITKNFVIENKGSAKLNLSGTPIVSISGSSSFAVSEQPLAAVVEVGGEVSFSVRYTPDCTTGVQNATVSIANDDVSIYNFQIGGVSIDNVAPLASIRDTVLQLDANGVASLLPADVDKGSTDNCSIASMTLSQTAFDCSQLGVNILTFTLVDASGNKTVSEVKVTIEDPHTITLGDLPGVCLNSEKLELPAGSPAGGSYSGPGVSEGMFDPAEAGEGVHKITYSVSNNGCASSVVGELSVWPLPEVSLAAFAKDTMQLDEEQVILPQGIPVGGYYFGEGVTGIRFDPSLAGTGVHNIYYAIRDENNCYNFDLTEIVVVNILDIHSVEDGDEVLIFPNPNHGEFFVETNEKCTMRVFNNQGGLVLSKEIHSGNRTKVTMNHLASGVYLIQLTTKTNVISKRVVIQR
jgi:predicted transcriptional regulator